MHNKSEGVNDDLKCWALFTKTQLVSLSPAGYAHSRGKSASCTLALFDQVNPDRYSNVIVYTLA